jgi:hypothetical protein
LAQCPFPDLLPRLHRALPSTSLDKKITTYKLEVYCIPSYTIRQRKILIKKIRPIFMKKVICPFLILIGWKKFPTNPSFFG